MFPPDNMLLVQWSMNDQGTLAMSDGGIHIYERPIGHKMRSVNTE